MRPSNENSDILRNKGKIIPLICFVLIIASIALILAAGIMNGLTLEKTLNLLNDYKGRPRLEYGLVVSLMFSVFAFTLAVATGVIGIPIAIFTIKVTNKWSISKNKKRKERITLFVFIIIFAFFVLLVVISAFYAYIGTLDCLTAVEGYYIDSPSFARDQLESIVLSAVALAAAVSAGILSLLYMLRQNGGY